MNWNDLIIRPQGARAKAQSSPPARFTSHSSEGSHNNKNQNKKTAYTDFFTKPKNSQCRIPISTASALFGKLLASP
jgi:hypothetical protein